MAIGNFNVVMMRKRVVSFHLVCVVLQMHEGTFSRDANKTKVVILIKFILS